tara:strand:- start:27 stop:263 length:237 start_codon:yes stop_codon:yes gene_type:complete
MTITVATADKLLIDISNGLYTDDLSARSVREFLLEHTDVWALSDRTMTAEQTAYRQALRDIPDQAGFPTDITWPTKPE